MLYLLVEEPSMEAALKNIIPKFGFKNGTFKVINFNGKAQLIRKLPERLRGFKSSITQGEKIKIVVLIDKDRDNCVNLKQTLEDISLKSGLISKTKAEIKGKLNFEIANCIVIEELESWFFGDSEAIFKAFPSLKVVPKGAQFNAPDNLSDTCEKLEKIFLSKNVYRNSYPKIEGAQKISPHLNINKNKSKSFNHFKSVIEKIK